MRKKMGMQHHMEVNNDLGWYETSLSTRERKRRGHFSTPPQLIERILDACGYTPDRDLSAVRVLDPACGSGNFLVAAARRLIASGKRLSYSPSTLMTIVQHMLWGLDPDPVACFLAEMQLRELLAHTLALSFASAQHEENEKDEENKGDKGEGGECAPMRLHIHQADGLTLQWRDGIEHGVDLFVANPPYLAAKNTDLSGYRSTQGRGQADSYLLFLELAVRVVRPNGWLALVLPDPVLVRANATRERQHLLAQTTVHHLWHLSGVFAAHVGAVVIIAQKQAPTHHHVGWVREKWAASHSLSSSPSSPSSPSPSPSLSSQPLSGMVPQQLWRQQPGAELRYLLTTHQDTLMSRLQQYWMAEEAHLSARFVPLGRLITMRRGEELGKESQFLRAQRPYDEHRWYPVLRGGVDVQMYTMAAHPPCWIAEHTLQKPLDRYLAPKLLIVKSTARLQAALDLQGHVVLQTLYMLLAPTPEVDENELYFLLALLNSRLLQEYVYVHFTAYKWVQPQIEQHVLAALPIPCCDATQKGPIIERAKYLARACSMPISVVELQQDSVYQEQERAIRALYERALP